jgi:hypothetical protein
MEIMTDEQIRRWLHKRLKRVEYDDQHKVVLTFEMAGITVIVTTDPNWQEASESFMQTVKKHIIREVKRYTAFDRHTTPGGDGKG